MTVKYAYLDLDAVAYTGASIAEKTAYQWVKKDGTEQSQEFDKADKAKEWWVSRTEMSDDIPEEDYGLWERKSIIKLQDVSVALKGVDNELKKWMDSCKQLFCKDVVFKGYLTCSGEKDKDLPGLEDRYQFNRYDPKLMKQGIWEGKPKPTHLPACRTHLLTAYDWIKMSPPRVEADAPIVYFTEHRGVDAVMGFKDKDVRQAYAGNFIEMNDIPKNRTLEVATELGQLGIKETLRGDKKYWGDGFKLLCFQTVVGDPSDGYKGVKGAGNVTGFDLFNELTTPEECCQALVDFYNEKFPNGHKYTSWDKKEITISAMDLLDQHMRLAYHERGAKDTLTPIRRFLNGDNPIYKH